MYENGHLMLDSYPLVGNLYKHFIFDFVKGVRKILEEREFCAFYLTINDRIWSILVHSYHLNTRTERIEIRCITDNYKGFEKLCLTIKCSQNNINILTTVQNQEEPLYGLSEYSSFKLAQAHKYLKEYHSIILEFEKNRNNIDKLIY